MCCCQIARHFKRLQVQCLIYLLNVCTMPSTMGSWLWQRRCSDTAIINCNYDWFPKSLLTSWGRVFQVCRGRRGSAWAHTRVPHPELPAWPPQGRAWPVAGAEGSRRLRGSRWGDRRLKGGSQGLCLSLSPWGPCESNLGFAKTFCTLSLGGRSQVSCWGQSSCTVATHWLLPVSLALFPPFKGAFEAWGPL